MVEVDRSNYSRKLFTVFTLSQSIGDWVHLHHLTDQLSADRFWQSRVQCGREWEYCAFHCHNSLIFSA